VKIAVIDIGTNTSRLAIFQASRGGDRDPEILLSRNIITRLGDGLVPGRRLSPSAVRRTLDAVYFFEEDIRQAGADCVAAVGTAALRHAADSENFLSKLKETGIEFEVISGETEGELVYRGALSGLEGTPGRLLVLDVGGGSTEFNFGGDGGFAGCRSVSLGAVEAAAECLRNDPPDDGEIETLYRHIREKISPVVEEWPEWTDGGNVHCVGVAGTITTMAMIDLGLDEYDPDRVHGHFMASGAIEESAGRLLEMNEDRRRAIPGIELGRADIIHAGAAIVDSIARAFRLEGITVSEKDIRYGLLERELERAGENSN